MGITIDAHPHSGWFILRTPACSAWAYTPYNKTPGCNSLLRDDCSRASPVSNNIVFSLYLRLAPRAWQAATASSFGASLQIT